MGARFVIYHTFAALLIQLLAACSLLTPIKTQESNLITMEPAEKISAILPAPLFFLKGGQIWKLNQDGIETVQISTEKKPIDEFDFNQVTQQFVLISDNNLILMDSDGTGREQMVTGESRNSFTDELSRLNNLDDIQKSIKSPHWSPDGKRIAFVRDGIQVLDLESKQTETIWNNSIESSTSVIFDRLLSWSPNSKFLLVSKYTLPISTINQRNLGLIQIGKQMVDICNCADVTFAWDSEFHNLYLANAFSGSDRSLIQCNMENYQCKLIAEFEPGRWYYFYAYPHIIAEDEMLVFLGASQDFSDTPEGFSLVKTRPGFGRSALRQDQYLIQSALWSPTGNGVIIITEEAAGDIPTGSMLWLTIDGAPAFLLSPIEATNMRWGVVE